MKSVKTRSQKPGTRSNNPPIPQSSNPPIDENSIANHLITQYRRAESARGAFVREAAAFGAMLITAEQRIGEPRGGAGGGAGDGLKGWLADACPEINYKTAMSYRVVAVRMAEMLGGETPEVLAALRSPHELQISYDPAGWEGRAPSRPNGTPDIETVDAEIIERREELFAAAESRRKLEQMYFDFVGKAERAERRGSEPAPLPKLRPQEAAKRIWAGLMAQLGKKTAMDSIALLPPADAKVCHDRLFELCKAMKAQMSVED